MDTQTQTSQSQAVPSVTKPPPADDNPIVFYCKDCEEIVETRRVGGKYVYTCKKCGTKNVAFGTKKSIYGFFKLEDKEKAKLRESKRQEKEKVATEKAAVEKAEVERAEGSKVIKPA